jgi:hypothetical protein
LEAIHYPIHFVFLPTKIEVMISTIGAGVSTKQESMESVLISFLFSYVLNKF